MIVFAHHRLLLLQFYMRIVANYTNLGRKISQIGQKVTIYVTNVCSYDK